MIEPNSIASRFNAYTPEQLLNEKFLTPEDVKKLRPPVQEELSDKERVKAAKRSAEHISRKVQTLDEVTSGVKKRYQDALDNLERLRYEYNMKMKNIEFMETARSKLCDQLAEKSQKSEELRKTLICEEARMAQVMKQMQLVARAATLEGIQDVAVLQHGMSNYVTGQTLSRRPKDVCAKLNSDELASLRGYSCRAGTTATSGMSNSASLPTLKLPA
eukprot:TRINITY_DN58762_c0_g1_i1.p1 TRINITY_DN58762_c0_g1~~TRINITY_DN58762_c0_g1_i1.p1  ORF type:complete len:217 (-),score=37.77 TRINITY_DN58762_c0_g1_i1:234-884(-)